jgi:pyruvate,water dikinase
MAVIVQHMIVADYAGVAFSSDPIKNIDNAMLIEIVKGSGESLVSSKKTPYSIRINKLTGMVRTQQIGHDNISEVQAYGLCEILLPVIERIESAYGIPVDVEWAISKNKLYILQARPITSI